MTDEPQDDRAQQEMEQERYERTLECLYQAMAYGLPEADVRHLCSETGVRFVDVERYVQPVLRTRERIHATQ